MHGQSMDQWWTAWAPYWEHIEDRHFGRRALQRVLPWVASPVLVIGAGLGILVQDLRNRGLVAEGVDSNAAMIASALRHRGIELKLADARQLPFAPASFRTVILSSGVLDYLQDDAATAPILQEALRVLTPGGSLLAGYYQIEPALERVYERLGVLTSEGWFPRRMFAIEDSLQVHPFHAVGMITAWTGRSYLPVLAQWCAIGLFRPPAITREQRRMHEVLEIAARDGVDRGTLVAAFPDRVPYRRAAELQAMWEAHGLRRTELVRLPDCLVVCHRKSVATHSPPSPDAESDWMVRVQGVSLRYPGAGRDALHEVDLTIPRGCIYGILGPNGAGKTTMMSILAGLLAPDRGTVRYRGASDAAAQRRSRGLVPQNLALYGRLTARENLATFGGLYGLSGSALAARLEHLLEAVGLTDQADARVDTFSSGMMRRLNLAAGLVHDPEILLLDEPTVGVDPQSRNRIFDLVLQEKRRGKTVLLTTQYLEEASRLSDHVVILDYGSVLVQGTPRELIARRGAHRIELHADQPVSSLLEALRAKEGILEVASQEQILTVTAGEGVDPVGLLEQLRSAATEHGVRLTLRKLEEPSLESVFLDLTGRSMRDTESP